MTETLRHPAGFVYCVGPWKRWIRITFPDYPDPHGAGYVWPPEARSRPSWPAIVARCRRGAVIAWEAGQARR